MLRKTAVAGITILALGLAPAAFADHDKRARRASYDYARVVDVEPIVRYFSVKTPHRECYDEVVYEYDRPWRRRGTAGPTIAGAILGGVIGHQFGSGRGNDLATVAGAVIGSAIANDRASRRAYHHSEPSTRTVERCSVSYDYHEEERIDGYRVTYRYNGQRFTTRTRHHPGGRIRVRVNVTPA